MAARGDDDGGMPRNPFRMPSDEEIFSLRDDERARKEEERKAFLRLPVSQKTTWSSRAGSMSRNILAEDAEALGDSRQLGGMRGDRALKQERHREKENMTDFIEKKRQAKILKSPTYEFVQMFLVQMSLDTKRAEIRKLEDQARQREEALRNSEHMLETDAARFEKFLKENDQQAVQAIKNAETETKLKQDKVHEIKKLTAQIAAVNSETTKYTESLEECLSYKKFLDDLTPQEWIAEQYQLHKERNLLLKVQVTQQRLQERAAEDAALEGEFNATMEHCKGNKKMLAQAEAEYADAKALRERERQKQDVIDLEWDPDQGVQFEAPMYFTRPQQLLDIFATLEERNLFLIQTSQETEEQLEELKLKLESTKTKMLEETEQLGSQINALKADIAGEEAKAAGLSERKSVNGGHDKEEDHATLLAFLHTRVSEVYERCGIGDDSSSGTLMMLANMEHKIESLLAVLVTMPPDEVERAEKEREKDRRARVRKDKADTQEALRQAKINKSIQLSLAPVVKRTGKPVMARAPPLVTRKREKDVKEERDEDLEDRIEFLSE